MPSQSRRKTYGGLRKFLEQSICSAALMSDSGPQAALNMSVGLRGGSGTSAPHLTNAETIPATKPINAARV